MDLEENLLPLQTVEKQILHLLGYVSAIHPKLTGIAFRITWAW